MIRILVADDHPIVRQGLKRILAAQPDMTVAAEATDGQEVLDHVAKNRFDIVVLDISMPGMDGLSVLRHLRDQEGAPPVLVLSTHSEEQYAKRVKSLGASGYLTKSKTPKELESAIRDVIHERRQRPSML